MMKSIKHYIWSMDAVLRDLITGICIYFVLISLLGVFIVENIPGYVFGALLGSLTSIGLAMHMYSSLDRGLDMEPDAAQKYIFSRSMMRLFLMLAAAYLGLQISQISFIGVGLGLFGLKVSGLMQPLVSAYITNKIFREGE